MHLQFSVLNGVEVFPEIGPMSNFVSSLKNNLSNYLKKLNVYFDQESENYPRRLTRVSAMAELAL